MARVRIHSINAAVMGVLLSAASTAAQSFHTPAPTFSVPHPAVVRVVAPERGGASYGSGVLVAVNESSGLVVTNWHVVRDAAGPIAVAFPDGFRSPAVVLRTDRDWDLAALAIRRPNVAPIAVSNKAPQPGEALTIAGYGSGAYRAVTGQCVQYLSPGGSQPFELVELSAPAREGDSGGPILNQRGELAGILFGSAFGRTTGSYCGRLRWFLKSVDGDFQRISNQALLARQRPVSPPPTVAIKAPTPSESEHHAVADTTGDAGVVSKCSSPPASVPSGPLLPSTEQIKTVLAFIGVVALVCYVLRLLGWALG